MSYFRSVSIALANVREIEVEGIVFMHHLNQNISSGLVRRLGMKADDIVQVIQNLFSTTTYATTDWKSRTIVIFRKNDELVVNEQILKSIAAKEKEKDKNKLYPKIACFEQSFVVSERNDQED